MSNIILASASPRRAEILKQIGIDFRIVTPDIIESFDYSLRNNGEMAQKLSHEKALDVAKKIGSESLIIAADTIVVKEEILGKPRDREHAIQMLSSLQGGWHEVITGVSIVRSVTLESAPGYEVTRVKMRSLNEKEIDSYIKTGEPFDKAGSYGIQGMGALLIEKIEGCYFNVVGLPVYKLSRLLEEFGVSIL